MQASRREAGQRRQSASAGPGGHRTGTAAIVTRAEVHWFGGLAERGLGSVGPLSDPDMEQKLHTLMGAFQRARGSPQTIRQTMTMMAQR